METLLFCLILVASWMLGSLESLGDHSFQIFSFSTQFWNPSHMIGRFQLGSYNYEASGNVSDWLAP